MKVKADTRAPAVRVPRGADGKKRKSVAEVRESNRKRVKRLAKKPTVKRPSKKLIKNILVGVRTPWLHYCNERRKASTDTVPKLKFGELPRLISGDWHAMSFEQKEPYRTLFEQDKLRYQQQKDNLDEEQQKMIRRWKREQRKIRSSRRPKKFLSAYMFFVNEKRGTLADRGLSFADTARELGSMWRNLDAAQKSGYLQMQDLAKQVYQKECERMKRDRERARPAHPSAQTIAAPKTD